MFSKPASISDLYNELPQKYDSREYWETDIATEYNISQAETSILLQALGYYRGKKVRTVSKTAFCSNQDVIKIYDKM